MSRWLIQHASIFEQRLREPGRHQNRVSKVPVFTFLSRFRHAIDVQMAVRRQLCRASAASLLSLFYKVHNGHLRCACTNNRLVGKYVTRWVAYSRVSPSQHEAQHQQRSWRLRGISSKTEMFCSSCGPFTTYSSGFWSNAPIVCATYSIFFTEFLEGRTLRSSSVYKTEKRKHWW